MAVVGLDHVLLLTDDVDETRAFYSAALGLEAGDRPALPFEGCWLYAGGRPCLHIADRASYAAHARTMDIAVPSGGGGAAGPVDHVALTADDHDDVAARLDRLGVPAVRNEVPEARLRQLFFEDPNGVRIEVNIVTPGR
jgi:catechol 2,3-dioxygenase-like lactoylglutathione lyase family enzyme